MPYPFTKGVFIYGDPVYVGHDAGADEMEDARLRLEGALNAITEEADAFFSK